MQPNNQIEKTHLKQAGAILGFDSLVFFNLANPFMLTLRSAQFLLHSYIAYSVCCDTSDENNDDDNCLLMKKRFIMALHMILGSMVLASAVMLSIAIHKDEIENCRTNETKHESLCSEVNLLAYIHFGMIAAAGAVGLIQGIKNNLITDNAEREPASPRL